MIDATIRLSAASLAKIVTDASGAWFKITDGSLASDQVAVFLPSRIPAEKVQTIVDAINDALDTVRPAQNEAA